MKAFRRTELTVAGLAVLAALLGSAFVLYSVNTDPNVSRDIGGVGAFLYLLLVALPTLGIGAALIMRWRWPIVIVAALELAYSGVAWSFVLNWDWGSGADFSTRLGMVLTSAVDLAALVVAVAGLLRRAVARSESLTSWE